MYLRVRHVDPRKRTNKAIQIGVFVVLSALLAVPIWLVKYPPLVDYPNHLARAFILHHLNDPHYNFAHFYASDWGLNPYFLADALIQVFQHFVGIYVAGRILLTLCILGLPMGVAFFLHRANPGNEYLALWALAIAYNPNFLMGFMSFELSVALCFFVVGDVAGLCEDRRRQILDLDAITGDAVFPDASGRIWSGGGRDRGAHAVHIGNGTEDGAGRTGVCAGRIIFPKREVSRMGEEGSGLYELALKLQIARDVGSLPGIHANA